MRIGVQIMRYFIYLYGTVANTNFKMFVLFLHSHLAFSANKLKMNIYRFRS